jgi:hypothetical protein
MLPLSAAATILAPADTPCPPLSSRCPRPQATVSSSSPSLVPSSPPCSSSANAAASPCGPTPAAPSTLLGPSLSWPAGSAAPQLLLMDGVSDASVVLLCQIVASRQSSWPAGFTPSQLDDRGCSRSTHADSSMHRCCALHCAHQHLLGSPSVLLTVTSVTALCAAQGLSSVMTHPSPPGRSGTLQLALYVQSSLQSCKGPD